MTDQSGETFPESARPQDAADAEQTSAAPLTEDGVPPEAGEGVAAEAPARRRGPLAFLRRRRVRLALTFSLALVLVVCGALAVAAYGTGYVYGPLPRPEPQKTTALPSDAGALKKLVTEQRNQNRKLLAALQKEAPEGVFVVIDQTQNRLYVKKDDQVLVEAVCSAGSGMILKESSPKGRKWVFDTPRGVFKVRNKLKNPVWKKPDWAFVEEGKPIPKDPSERFEYGTLGEYALYLEDGYMIHGTLYERLLGRNVTHGCIRLGKEDLRLVWADVPIGTPVYIY